ncbi:peptidoglycan-binding domain-containing protein [Ruegeria sp. HKCCSP335]|uniref:peptidoglycan-binding domain-containing protein n=1 Tax=Ruegeria sp. HKCCSP335 TaxID=2794833 RepID=UPI001AE8ED19|nr:peptidoglycan-binding domain-containing protein [Ruegeria sp. HKCCSP335]
MVKLNIAILGWDMIKRDRLSSALRMDDRLVKRALIGLMLALLLLAPASAQDTSQNSAAQSPDQLFVDAVTLYHQVSVKNEEEATSDLMEVARLFQRIQTDFPESAPAYLIAAGGFPGGVDLSRLPEIPSDAAKSTSTAVAPQSDPLDLSDLGMMMAFLQSHYPETLASLQIDPSAITQDAVGALQLRIAYMIAVFVSNGAEAAGEGIIDPSEYMSVLNAMAEDSGLLDSTTVFSEQLIEDITEKKLQEVAASVFADIVMSGPWPEMSPEFQNMLRAGVDAAFKEGWDLMKAKEDPSVAVSMVFGRMKDARDIMVATNALNRTQERGLIQTALSMQTAAWLFVSYPDSPNTQQAVKGALYDMQSSVADIVGEDDAPTVTRIFNVGFGALRAAYRGETKRAEKLVGDIQEMGAESNIPALNVADNLLVIANLGQDAPARAANIMLGVTDLANIHEENHAAAARRSPVMDVSSTQTIPSVWGPEIVVPTNHSVWNRRYDRREDQRSVLVDLGVTNRAIDFSERYDPEYIGEAFAVEFIELGNVDLVHMRIGHVAATSDRFRPSVIVNGSTGVVPVTGPPFKISGTFLDNASQKLAGRIPNLIGTSSGVMHRLLPGGGQRFIELTMLSDGCRDCKAVGTSVRFIDYDETGQFVRTTNVGLVDHSVGFLFNAQNSVSEDPSGWRHMDFAQDAKALQYRLNMLGYNAGEMDGIPGPQTRQALMEFQAENCLEITAQPSLETVRALQSADGLSATCANTVVPEVISANSPLVPGTYVSDTKWCDRNSIPYDLVFEVQRLVRPSFILFGIEDGFEITRSDIVKGITQLKGNYHVGNAVDPGKFLIDVLSPETYREPLVGTVSGGKTYSRCPNDSVLVTSTTGISSAPNSSQTAPEQSIIPSSTGRPFEPPRGSELRKIILDAARPDAEALYGPDVEFLVGTLRVIEERAYLAATAQRPGGIPINVTDTPAFREGLVDLNLGNPTGFEAILQHEAGVWHVRQSVGQVTEAWWLENCPDWELLFPETCGGTTVEDYVHALENQLILPGPGRSAQLLYSENVVDPIIEDLKRGKLTIRQEVVAFPAECRVDFTEIRETNPGGFFLRVTTKMDVRGIDLDGLDKLPQFLSDLVNDTSPAVVFRAKNAPFETEGEVIGGPENLAVLSGMFLGCGPRDCTTTGHSYFAHASAKNGSQATKVRDQIVDLAEQCSRPQPKGVRGQIDWEAAMRKVRDYDYHSQRCRQPEANGITCRAWHLYKSIDDVIHEFDITLSEFLEWNGLPLGTPGHTKLETATWYVISDQPPEFKVTHGNPLCKNAETNGLICVGKVEDTTFEDLAGYHWKNGEFLELNNLPADTDPNTFVPAYQMWAIRVAR